MKPGDRWSGQRQKPSALLGGWPGCLPAEKRSTQNVNIPLHPSCSPPCRGAFSGWKKHGGYFSPKKSDVSASYCTCLRSPEVLPTQVLQSTGRNQMKTNSCGSVLKLLGRCVQRRRRKALQRIWTGLMCCSCKVISRDHGVLGQRWCAILAQGTPGAALAFK